MTQDNIRIKENKLIDYYGEIKREFIDNELNKRVKDYSKNKYEIHKY